MRFPRLNNIILLLVGLSSPAFGVCFETRGQSEITVSQADAASPSHTITEGESRSCPAGAFEIRLSFGEEYLNVVKTLCKGRESSVCVKTVPSQICEAGRAIIVTSRFEGGDFTSTSCLTKNTDKK